MDPFTQLSSHNRSLQPLQIAFAKNEIEMRMLAIRKLEEEVKKYQSLLSPLREFPIEILGEVFMAVVATIDKPGDISTVVQSLSLVCKTWRAAALTTPQIWSTVGVDLCHDIVDFEKISKWLARSGATSRSLTISSGQACTDHDFGCLLLDNGLVKLLRAGPSIHQLKINSWSSECFQWLTQALENPEAENQVISSSRLQSIELNSSELGLVPHFASVEGDLAPYLFPQTLNLDIPLNQADAQAIHGTAYIQALLANLTSFAFPFIWPTTWDQGVLPLCKNLHTLTMKIDFDNDWIDEHLSVGPHSLVREGGCIAFPNLRTLRIEELPVGIGWDLAILRLFETPALVKLDAEFYNDDYGNVECDHPGKEIASLLERSKCDKTFTQLRIGNISFGEECLKDILTHLPSLTNLTLDRVYLNSSFFCLPGIENILPNLQVLELRRMYESFGYQEVCNFISTRRWREGIRSRQSGHFKRIQKFVVELSSDWGRHPDSSDALESLRKQGVDAHVYIGTHP